MKIDRYTKVVLTIIAACLVWIAIGGPSLATPAHAASPSVVYVAGVWDLDSTPHTFYKQGEPTGAALPVEVVGAKSHATDRP